MRRRCWPCSRRATVADLGEVEYTLGDLIDEWTISDLDLEQGARVVEVAGGQIVAYAALRRPGSFVVVAPDHEGRGIGSRLLEWTEQRDRERGRDMHRQWVAGANASARALLTGAGYRRARSYARMVRRLRTPLRRRTHRRTSPCAPLIRRTTRRACTRSTPRASPPRPITPPSRWPSSLRKSTRCARLQGRAEPRGDRGRKRSSASCSRAGTRERTSAGCTSWPLRPSTRAGDSARRCCTAPSPRSPRRGSGRPGSASRPTTIAGTRFYERAGMAVRYQFDVYERRPG